MKIVMIKVMHGWRGGTGYTWGCFPYCTSKFNHGENIQYCSSSPCSNLFVNLQPTIDLECSIVYCLAFFLENMNIDLGNCTSWNMSIDKHSGSKAKYLQIQVGLQSYIIEAKLISASTYKTIYYYMRMLPGHSVLSGLWLHGSVQYSLCSYCVNTSCPDLTGPFPPLNTCTTFDPTISSN